MVATDMLFIDSVTTNRTF